MKLEIGDNLVHLMQLAILSATAVGLALYGHVDVTALLVALFGTGGVLSAMQLRNIAANNASAASVAPTAPAAPEPAEAPLAPQNGPPTPEAG